MHDRIEEKLHQLELEKKIRVLFSCESGSRAWGFPSPDSDYDVRLVYTHDIAWHLQIGKTRDTIEQLQPGDIDLGGWELKKALTLFASCNLPLNEWLGSPTAYRETGSFRTDVMNLIPEYFNGRKALHHYFSLAANTSKKELFGSEIRIKKLFYILRPVYACLWILRSHTMPPTTFPAMLQQGLAIRNIEAEIQEMMRAKETAIECDKVTLSPSFENWIQTSLTEIEEQTSEYPPPEKAPLLEPLNELLRFYIPCDRELI